ncbi:MAG TPA: hypothetical protein VGO61_07035 [Steroidobacteraceae bacterium]|jgi:hypothetical protein|nr:hypothetical protein [Steroidobacteraceae bacterium]
MSHFFVNNFAQPDGNHEVHLVGCKSMPSDKRYLGNFYSVSEALIEARKDFWQSSGCERCARELPYANSVGRIGAQGVASWGRFR